MDEQTSRGRLERAVLEIERAIALAVVCTLAVQTWRSIRASSTAAAEMQKRIDRLMDAAELAAREREFPEG